MKQSDVNKTVKKIIAEQQIKSAEDGVNRARSVTVGTAFGGSIELSMRIDGRTIWSILQPVEALVATKKTVNGRNAKRTAKSS